LGDRPVVRRSLPRSTGCLTVYSIEVASESHSRGYDRLPPFRRPAGRAATSHRVQSSEFGSQPPISHHSRLRPGEVRLRLSRNHEIAKFERFFGCPVRFGTRHNSLTFSPYHLALLIATADRRLHGILTGYCEEILASREKLARFTARVERLMAKLLCRGDARPRWSPTSLVRIMLQCLTRPGTLAPESKLLGPALRASRDTDHSVVFREIL